VRGEDAIRSGRWLPLCVPIPSSLPRLPLSLPRRAGNIAAMPPSKPTHCVAVIGGATAGAEVAGRLAELGTVVVVFEQNPWPYGKIEDGLPRWHEALRKKEYANIEAKLSRPGVHFVPNTKVGRDVDFAALANEWGFSALVLACGAWRDRPVPIEGIDEYVGKGLVYQNPFVISFNHENDESFEGERFEYPDGCIVLGGGLASIDVSKILMLTNARRALAAHGLEYEDLDLEGCTLFYRRTMQDMPLMEIPEDADAARVEKVRNARQRMLDKAMEKYRFKIEPLAAPDGMIVENDRLVGIRFRRTRIEGGRVVLTDETFERRGTRVISSIGSIPEPIAGIPMRGELFEFTDWDVGRLADYPTVFSVGNVVTGKGNIVASRKHAAHVSEEAVESFLGLHDDRGAESADEGSTAGRAARETADRIAAQLPAPLSCEAIAAILARVEERQRVVGYPGDYKAWMERVHIED
jgi:NADPH-dependent glutamate synthase beta subunit-like oxidoreductase